MRWFIGKAMEATQCPKEALYHCVELKEQRGSSCTAKNYKYDTMYYDLVTSGAIFMKCNSMDIYLLLQSSCLLYDIYWILSNKTLTWCKVFKVKCFVSVLHWLTVWLCSQWLKVFVWKEMLKCTLGSGDIITRFLKETHKKLNKLNLCKTLHDIYAVLCHVCLRCRQSRLRNQFTYCFVLGFRSISTLFFQ